MRILLVYAKKVVPSNSQLINDIGEMSGVVQRERGNKLW